jgi:hypothetical protein
MHVVVSAGNEAVNAALVSPAGAAFGYTMPGPPPVVMRFWSGALPPGALLFRAPAELTVAGGCDFAGGVLQLWPLSNRNAGPIAAVDGYAPAANVPCAAAAGPPYAVGSGTSYAAGLTAGLVAWQAWMRPWAPPAMARQWLNASMTVQPAGWMKIETPVLPRAGLTWSEWIEQYYPAAVSTLAERDPAGDPDNDRVLNFIEYFNGGDPRYPDEKTDPEISAQHGEGGDRVTLRMPTACYLPDASQVKWTVEESCDLSEWQELSFPALRAVTPAVIRGDGYLCESATTLPPAARRFLRIRFTCLP